MRLVNVEIKARCPDPAKIRALLEAKGARFAGADHQVDTYFRVASGRLKLRQGNIENALIFYRRPDQQGPKESDVALYPVAPGSELRPLLAEALGVLATVDKQREIYFIANVKFHIDRVEGLGDFVEIEAAGKEGAERGALSRQCRSYMELFGIAEDELVSKSYSDLVGVS
jgi:adenylate cyclase class 2